MNTLSQTMKKKNYWDKAGIGASLLCLLHCLATPFLITALPILAATEHQTHSVLAVFMLLIGLLAFLPGYRKHRRKAIPGAGAIGLAAIIAATLLPEMEGRETIETLMVVGGGVILIASHLRNSYWCRFCSVCGDQSCALQEGRALPGRSTQ